MMDNRTYQEYEKGLIESLYVNGYSDVYSQNYIYETARRCDYPIFAENFEKLSSINYDTVSHMFGCEVLFNALSRRTENKCECSFFYYSRDNKHYLALKIIKKGNVANLFVVNSSPRTIYLPREDDNLIKMIFKSGVTKLSVKEFKPPIYQVGSFACFMYAVKNLKLLSNFSEEQLLNSKFSEDKVIGEKKCINENLFSTMLYSDLVRMYDSVSKSTMDIDFSMDKRMMAILETTSSDDSLKKDLYKEIVFKDEKRLKELNKLRLERQKEYLKSEKELAYSLEASIKMQGLLEKSVEKTTSSSSRGVGV